MYTYRFSNINFGYNIDNKMSIQRFKPFLVNNRKADINIHYSGVYEIEEPETEFLFEEYIENDIQLIVYNAGNSKYCFCLRRKSKKNVICKLNIDREWVNALVVYKKNEPEIDYYSYGVIGNLLIRNKVLFYQGFVMHASSIKFNGKGIVFSAPSGTGKSTQAALWEKYYHAEIINDDCPIIKISNSKVKVYGSPWSGSTNKFRNTSAPLKAVIILEQSNINSLVRVNNTDAYKYILPRCFLPYYDKEMIETAVKNIEEIISTIPVFLLKCKPDKEAVKLVKETLFSNIKN